MKYPDKLTYRYDTKGYMLYYRDRPIGGAGIDRSARGCRSNLKLFREGAELDIRNLRDGRGIRMYLDVIERIDAELDSVEGQ